MQREAEGHFDNMALDYDWARPGYPNELFKVIAGYSKLSRGSRALEIGPGTGKATLPFLGMGLQVDAVEIGANLAESLSKKFESYDNLKVEISSFEDALLEERCYDLVYAATSFHWVDPAVGCPKAYRILKDGGAFALFRYNAVPARGNSALNAQIQAAYKAFYHKRQDSSGREPVVNPTVARKAFGFDSLEIFGFSDIETKRFETSTPFDAEGYMDLLGTYPDHLELPEENRLALFEGIKAAIIEHGNQITVGWSYILYMGRKAHELHT
ncbi:MAG: class I SAM-dependent methyltransferase [Eubacteriaceae bacterium]|nr:class I SAM-dependent methyltransferase [Eubacteriaceae bacterium]